MVDLLAEGLRALEDLAPSPVVDFYCEIQYQLIKRC